MNAQPGFPAWLPLLSKPYENLLGSRTAWDLSLPDGTPVRVERSGLGLVSPLYRVRVAGGIYACKLFPLDDRRRAEREWSALCNCRAAGLDLAPIPVALALEAPLPQPMIVCEWLEGVPFTGRTLTEADLRDLFAQLSAMHRVLPSAGHSFLAAYGQPAGYRAYLDEACGFLAEIKTWVEDPGRRTAGLPEWAVDLPELFPLLQEGLRRADMALAANAVADHDWPLAFIRADGDLDRVLRRSDRQLAFSDWASSGWGDAAYDVAALRWHPRSLRVSTDKWPAGRAAYTLPTSDPNFLQRLALYDELMPAWWAARSALHLVNGLRRPAGGARLTRVPSRLLCAARRQLDHYLAALGLAELPEDDEIDEG